MKKSFSLLILLLTVGGFAQKTLEIYNLSSKTISLNMVATKHVTDPFPWCASVAPSSISIAPGDSYIMENTSNIYRFPFNSSVSSPVMTNWRRVIAPVPPSQNSTWTNISSASAWTLGTSQIFDYITFGVNGGTEGSGSIGEPSFWVTANPLTNTTHGWQAIYDVSYVTSTLIFNTVVFMDYP